MQNVPATLFCPNYNCQAGNPESHKFCQRCRTLLPKRYLWVLGKGLEAYRPGTLMAGRYLLKHSRILLDTQPGLLPESAEELPDFIQPYLRLAAYRLHIPQIYARLQVSEGRSPATFWLLEQIPVYPSGLETPDATQFSNQNLSTLAGQLMPELTSSWQTASGLRQLNWLWQIAQLWQPLSSEGLAATLLDTKLLRVEGALVRLLELSAHPTAPSLVQLGQLWSQWSTTAQPSIREFLESLCQQMIQGRVSTAEHLTAILDQALAVCGQAQARQIQLATLSDKGPSRQRNEDACFPPSGSYATLVAAAGRDRFTPTVPLAIVCDGIGGHEGGDVASALAIAAVQQQVKSLPHTALDPLTVTAELEQAAYAANDVISQRNDNEQRQDRQRMGTTLVIALAHAHELFITHIGDSRVYRITRTGCHQVTLDDDLASREMRLGYTLYRDALLQPGSGSLIQALGMAGSSFLHPTVQRFVLDEDCVFLLCSDGLSDNDQVEAYWDTEIVPILDGKVDLVTASQRLVAIANSQNGHDNVTVGLVYCQVADIVPVPLSAEVGLQSATLTPGDTVPAPLPSEAVNSSTQILFPKHKSTSSLSLLLGSIALLGLGAALAYVLVPGFADRVNPLVGLAPETSTSSEPSPPLPADSPVPTPPATPTLLTVESFLEIDGSALANAPSQIQQLTLQPQPGQPENQPAAVLGSLPSGSIVQIQSRLEIPQQGYWLNLKVCSVPTSSNATSGNNPAVKRASPPSNQKPKTSASPISSPQKAQTTTSSLRLGQEGWIAESAIAPFVRQPSTLSPNQKQGCTTTSNSPVPSAIPSVSPSTKPISP